MKAVQIGAGRIGRGFLAQLYQESGFEITFIDADGSLVDLLNESGQYVIEIVEPYSEILMHGFRATRTDSKESIEALAEADIASTAVGVGALQGVVPLLQAAEQRRSRPLDVILAENLHQAADQMRRRSGLEGQIGFVEASIGRMVPDQNPKDPLRIRVEAFCDLPVDRDAFLGPIPPISHLQPRSGFAAYAERKLYLHNAGHAAAAYLGFLAGHGYIWESMEDPAVASGVRKAMDEAVEALHRRHGLPLGELQDHAADLRRRFGSRALGDTIKRVGADPIRKLGRHERLIGAMEMCAEFGLPFEGLARTAAAALQFRDPDWQRLVAEFGAREALSKVSELPSDSPAVNLILALSS